MNAKWTKILAPLACTIFAACGPPVDSTPDGQPMSKTEVAERLTTGKADHSTDWCERFDWYGDGICDDFCVNPDPDCETDDYEPCADLACGDSCSVCDPADPDCFETAVLKQCQPDGTCSASVAQCGGDDDTNNDDGDSYEPCGGLTCGDSCTICDPDDADCVETAVLKVCQPDGTCSANVPTCDGGDDEYDPCEGLACGESCSVCDPADPDCYETAVLKFCQADGTCSGVEPDTCTPAYDPCDGKMCGDSCSLCDPNDPDCFETLEVKACTADGLCVADTTVVCQ